jgi:hypothetical protein
MVSGLLLSFISLGIWFSWLIAIYIGSFPEIFSNGNYDAFKLQFLLLGILFILGISAFIAGHNLLVKTMMLEKPDS